MTDPFASYREIATGAFRDGRDRVFGAHDAASRLGLSRYADDPVAFAREALGHNTWAASRATMRALIEKRRVLVCSCRKSSKTFTAAEIVPAFVCTAPTICVTTAATYTQVRELLWAKILTNVTQARRKLPGRLGVTSLRVSPDWYAIGMSTNQPGNIQGFHGGVHLPGEYDRDLDGTAVTADHKMALAAPEDVFEETLAAWERGPPTTRLLFVLDEMPEIRAPILETLQGSWMGENVYVLGQGNPTLEPDSAHPFMRFLRGGAPWWRIHIAGREVPAEDHPDDLFDECFHGVPPEIMPAEWIEERARDWGENSALFQAHVLGLPGTIDREDQFLPPRVMRQALENAATIQDDLRLSGRHIGWDVAASEGGDLNVLSVWVNGQLTLEDQWHSADTIASAHRLIDAATRFGIEGKPIPARNWHVDSTGVGKGPTDYLRHAGYAVDTVDFGSAPLGDWPELTGEQQFADRKSELLWIMRRAIQEGILGIPGRFEDVRRQAAWYTYRNVPRAAGTAIRVRESKDDLRATFGRSPDNLEAAMCAWSRGARKPSFRAIRDLRQISRGAH